MNLEEFLDADPFEPTAAPAPKKRGRPAAKPKAATKPRWSIGRHNCDELISYLMEVAVILEPQTVGNVAARLRIAAELFELIENKKA